MLTPRSDSLMGARRRGGGDTGDGVGGGKARWRRQASAVAERRHLHGRGRQGGAGVDGETGTAWAAGRCGWRPPRHGDVFTAHAAMIVAFFVLLGAATTPRVPPLRAARLARMGATSATTSVPAPPFHYHRRA